MDEMDGWDEWMDGDGWMFSDSFFRFRFPAQGGLRNLVILIFLHMHAATERAQAARLPHGLLESLPVEAQK